MKKEIDKRTSEKIEKITKRYIRETQLIMQRFANAILEIEYETGNQK